MDTEYINPANDVIDITNFPTDIVATYGSPAVHAYVVDAGGGGNLVLTPAGGTQRTLAIVNDGEQLPCMINSLDAGTTIARVRIFFNG